MEYEKMHVLECRTNKLVSRIESRCSRRNFEDVVLETTLWARWRWSFLKNWIWWWSEFDVFDGRFLFHLELNNLHWWFWSCLECPFPLQTKSRDKYTPHHHIVFFHRQPAAIIFGPHSTVLETQTSKNWSCHYWYAYSALECHFFLWIKLKTTIP